MSTILNPTTAKKSFLKYNNVVEEADVLTILITNINTMMGERMPSANLARLKVSVTIQLRRKNE